MAGPRNEQGRGGGAAAADAVRAVVGPVVHTAGLWLEDVQVSRAGARSVVRVTVDLPEDEVGALGSDALDEVSRAVSAALDADDVVPGAYTLEVSTPGTSRPLTQLRHFKRARTRLVSLRLADGRTLEARLLDVLEAGTEGAEDGAVLVLDGGARVPVADVRKGRVEVELKRLDDLDDTQDTDETGDEGDDVGADAADDAEDADDAGPARTQEG
ncbi:ribosome maturation factor RimP [Xylanimonas oleitrophica]|uniref:Ribosome maturation factor RimP n=1 Tax=Xylanimonas oleitrophica TaxID=2607479 RepID=A0A2W5WVQ1_9MICO|nr:ribosome maturation factor RimP [Xylanimonas oleitrophica]PZR55387.1 ribosome maturation factor RimP [Xylanimonas oleitrophica]